MRLFLGILIGFAIAYAIGWAFSKGHLGGANSSPAAPSPAQGANSSPYSAEELAQLAASENYNKIR